MTTDRNGRPAVSLVDALDQAIANLESRRADVDAAMKDLRRARASACELLPDLRTYPVADAVPATPRRTGFDRVVEFLRACDGPQTVAQIADATGVSRSLIAAVLYRSHADRFVRVDLPRGAAKGWTLRETGPSEEVQP